MATLFAAIASPQSAPAPAPAPTPGYPLYSAASIVDTSNQVPQAFGPNTIVTVYGTNLSFDTASANSVGGILPTQLDGVSVLIGGYYANLFFVSPTQINLLIPYNLTAGATTLTVLRDSAAGPTIPITLNAAAPGMFVYNGFVMATHLNGTLVSAALPATTGEIIVVYATGLGRVTPDITPGRIVSTANPLVASAQFQVLLNGKVCPAGSVLYVGLAPGFAGLYQINLVVPPLTPSNPQIQLSEGNQVSPASTLLAVQ
jgi:uncharacterized protein (TIGR03437 family)